VDAAVAALVAARRVEVFGVGASGLVAEDLQQKLHRIGRPAFASRDPHAALTSAALLGAGDVVVGISHTGRTRDTLEPMREAARGGAATIAITNAPRSPIARAATHLLTTATVETTFRSGAMASRIAQLVIVDCLFVGVVQATYDASVTALTRTFEAVRDRRETSR
jgi:DNA-binding MurR/RpiR family transcriptional regulator